MSGGAKYASVNRLTDQFAQQFASVGVYFERSYRVWYWGNAHLNFGVQPALTYEFDGTWNSTGDRVRHRVHSTKLDFILAPRLARDFGEHVRFDFSYQFHLGGLSYYNVEYVRKVDEHQSLTGAF